MFNKIAKYRKKAGLTQIELAEKIGASQSALSRWESGKETPSMEILEKIAETLEITPFDLFERGKEYNSTRTRHINEFDNEQLMHLLKEADEIINAFRYMSNYDRAKLLNMAKAAFPEAFEEAKTQKYNFNPYQIYAERNNMLWESEQTHAPHKEAEPSDREKTDAGKPDTQ